MANNKVELADGTVLIDLTGDTAVASDVASGKTFHLADGGQTVGTANIFPPAVIESGNTPVRINNNFYTCTSNTYENTGISLTIPRTGSYTLRWMIFCENEGSSANSALYVNGISAKTSGITASSGNHAKRGVLTTELNAGDVVELYCKGAYSNGKYYGGCGFLYLSINGNNGF